MKYCNVYIYILSDILRFKSCNILPVDIDDKFHHVLMDISQTLILQIQKQHPNMYKMVCIYRCDPPQL